MRPAKHIDALCEQLRDLAYLDKQPTPEQWLKWYEAAAELGEPAKTYVRCHGPYKSLRGARRAATNARRDRCQDNPVKWAAPETVPELRARKVPMFLALRSIPWANLGRMFRQSERLAPLAKEHELLKAIDCGAHKIVYLPCLHVPKRIPWPKGRTGFDLPGAAGFASAAVNDAALQRQDGYGRIRFRYSPKERLIVRSRTHASHSFQRAEWTPLELGTFSRSLALARLQSLSRGLELRYWPWVFYVAPIVHVCQTNDGGAAWYHVQRTSTPLCEHWWCECPHQAPVGQLDIYRACLECDGTGRRADRVCIFCDGRGEGYQHFAGEGYPDDTEDEA